MAEIGTSEDASTEGCPFRQNKGESPPVVSERLKSVRYTCETKTISCEITTFKDGKREDKRIVEVQLPESLYAKEALKIAALVLLRMVDPEELKTFIDTITYRLPTPANFTDIFNDRLLQVEAREKDLSNIDIVGQTIAEMSAFNTFLSQILRRYYSSNVFELIDQNDVETAHNILNNYATLKQALLNNAATIHRQVINGNFEERLGYQYMNGALNFFLKSINFFPLIKANSLKKFINKVTNARNTEETKQLHKSFIMYLL